ncbi:hypothetical protein ES707_05862 [subsurface metagenome]
MRASNRFFDPLLEHIRTLPVVDCHDHSAECGPACTDPIGAIISGYFPSDIQSASSDEEVQKIIDTSLSLEERWPVLERAWKRTSHTGYAQVTRRVLKHFYGEDELSLDALKRIEGKLLDLEDEKTWIGILDEAGIVCRLANISIDEKKIMDGSLKLPPRARIVIGLPAYHQIRSFEEVQTIGSVVGKRITSLDEFLHTCHEIFTAYKAYGAVAFKDQSAYSRDIGYTNPPRAEAERVFNSFIEDPRRSSSYPEGIRPLDDYLFHEFMRMARELELPVQIHTGHMAGIRNDIRKTNAALFTNVLELHRDVRFDLFHANWPYSGELLFLCKNYPNVAIDFCWTNIIDPIYCRRMLEQAISCVPHSKIHGYGSDFEGHVERAWAHVQIARENIAVALSNLVDMEYLGLEEAKVVARDILFTNPNEFFDLGL